MPDIPEAIRAYFDDVVPPVPVKATTEHPDGDTAVPVRRRGSRAWIGVAAAAAVVLLVSAALLVGGRTETLDVGGIGADGDSSPEVPGTDPSASAVTILGPEALDSLARCSGVVDLPGSDVDTPGRDRLDNPRNDVIAAVEGYGAAHSEDYAGIRIDRTTVGWPIVVAFTSNVDEHRTAVADMVANLPDSSWPVVVTQVRLSSDEFSLLANQALQAVREVNAEIADPNDHATYVNAPWSLQWVVISVPTPDGTAQQRLAERLAGKSVCFVTPGDGSGIEPPPPVDTWTTEVSGAIDGN